MKRRAVFGTLCALLLTLALCACQGAGGSAQNQGEAVQWKQQEGADENQFWTRWGIDQLPYDEGDFLAAADRAPLTDPESLRLTDVVGITVEKATVAGKACVHVADGRAQGLMITPDGGTLISRDFTSLWVSTPEGTWQEADYCDAHALLTPDGGGLIYGSGKAIRNVYNWQIYWCDLASRETVQLTDDPTMSYELCGLMGEEAVLCRQVDLDHDYQVTLVVVDRRGTVTPLDLAASDGCYAQAKQGCLLYADGRADGDLTVYRWTGGTALEPVCTLPAGQWWLWEDDAISPDGTRLACYAGDQLWLVEVSTGETRTLALPPWEKEVERVSVSWRDEETLFVGLESVPESDIVTWDAWTGTV